MRNDAGRSAGNRAELQRLGLRSLSEEQAGASLSGHERNRLFRRSGPDEFADISGVSGLDDPADGRAFGILDYDRDGLPDIAIVNANAPRLELFRNQLGCAGAGAAAFPAPGGMVALRFVGGNHQATPSTEWSARDGFGATVSLDLGDGRTLHREHRAGEGLAAQNSATMLVGIGAHDRVSSLTVAWPSGKEQTAHDVASGTLLIVYENAALSPGGQTFERRTYRKPQLTKTRPASPRPALAPRLRPLQPANQEGKQRRPELRLYTTMATWCAACESELPQFRRLRELFSAEELAMSGVPIDSEETIEQIESWRAAHEPAYELLSELSEAQVGLVTGLVLEQLGFDAVPATLVTDSHGKLVLAQWGPPSVSRIRELLRQQQRKDATPLQCRD